MALTPVEMFQWISEKISVLEGLPSKKYEAEALQKICPKVLQVLQDTANNKKEQNVGKVFTACCDSFFTNREDTVAFAIAGEYIKQFIGRVIQHNQISDEEKRENRIVCSGIQSSLRAQPVPIARVHPVVPEEPRPMLILPQVRGVPIWPPWNNNAHMAAATSSAEPRSRSSTADTEEEAMLIQAARNSNRNIPEQQSSNSGILNRANRPPRQQQVLASNQPPKVIAAIDLEQADKPIKQEVVEVKEDKPQHANVVVDETIAYAQSQQSEERARSDEVVDETVATGGAEEYEEDNDPFLKSFVRKSARSSSGRFSEAKEKTASSDANIDQRAQVALLPREEQEDEIPPLLNVKDEVESEPEDGHNSEDKAESEDKQDSIDNVRETESAHAAPAGMEVEDEEHDSEDKAEETEVAAPAAGMEMEDEEHDSDDKVGETEAAAAMEVEDGEDEPFYGNVTEEVNERDQLLDKPNEVEEANEGNEGEDEDGEEEEDEDGEEEEDESDEDEEEAENEEEADENEKKDDNESTKTEVVRPYSKLPQTGADQASKGSRAKKRPLMILEKGAKEVGVIAKAIKISPDEISEFDQALEQQSTSSAPSKPKYSSKVKLYKRPDYEKEQKQKRILARGGKVLRFSEEAPRLLEFQMDEGNILRGKPYTNENMFCVPPLTTNFMKPVWVRKDAPANGGSMANKRQQACQTKTDIEELVQQVESADLMRQKQASQMEAGETISQSKRVTRITRLILTDSLLARLDERVLRNTNILRSVEHPRGLKMFVDTLEAEKKSLTKPGRLMNFSFSYIFLAYGHECIAQQAKSRRGPRFEGILDEIKSLRCWFHTLEGTALTKRSNESEDKCFTYGFVAPTIVLVTIPEIGEQSATLHRFNQALKQLVESDKERNSECPLRLLDWADAVHKSVAAQQSEQSENERLRLLVLELMHNDYGVLVK